MSTSKSASTSSSLSTSQLTTVGTSQNDSASISEISHTPTSNATTGTPSQYVPESSQTSETQNVQTQINNSIQTTNLNQFTKTYNIGSLNMTNPISVSENKNNN
ncbi:hypothetical protein V2J48_00575 [Staphylococcus saccharolyticus]